MSLADAQYPQLSTTLFFSYEMIADNLFLLGGRGRWRHSCSIEAVIEVIDMQSKEEMVPTQENSFINDLNLCIKYN